MYFISEGSDCVTVPNRCKNIVIFFNFQDGGHVAFCWGHIRSTHEHFLVVFISQNLTGTGQIASVI